MNKDNNELPNIFFNIIVRLIHFPDSSILHVIDLK